MAAKRPWRLWQKDPYLPSWYWDSSYATEAAALAAKARKEAGRGNVHRYMVTGPAPQ